jgi:hypothetical protein
MTTVSSFFKHDAEQNFGVFYPTNYLVATFASHDLALQAKEELVASGVHGDDVLILRGEEFVALEEKAHEDASLWSRVTSHISKVLGTEELHLEHDLKNARAGAAFLALHCPTQEEGQRIFRLLKHLAPLSMRRYSPYAIDRIV